MKMKSRDLPKALYTSKHLPSSNPNFPLSQAFTQARTLSFFLSLKIGSLSSKKNSENPPKPSSQGPFL